MKQPIFTVFLFSSSMAIAMAMEDENHWEKVPQEICFVIYQYCPESIGALAATCKRQKEYISNWKKPVTDILDNQKLDEYLKAVQICKLDNPAAIIWIKKELKNDKDYDPIVDYAQSIITDKNLSDEIVTRKIKKLVILGLNPNAGSMRFAERWHERCNRMFDKQEIRKKVQEIKKENQLYTLIHSATGVDCIPLLEFLLSLPTINPMPEQWQNCYTPFFEINSAPAIDLFLKHPDSLKNKKQAELLIYRAIGHDCCTQTMLEHSLVDFFNEVSKESYYLFFDYHCPLKKCFLHGKTMNTINLLYAKYGKDLFKQCDHCDPQELLDDIHSHIERTKPNVQDRYDDVIKFLKDNFLN